MAPGKYPAVPVNLFLKKCEKCEKSDYFNDLNDSSI